MTEDGAHAEPPAGAGLKKALQLFDRGWLRAGRARGSPGKRAEGGVAFEKRRGSACRLFLYHGKETPRTDVRLTVVVSRTKPRSGGSEAASTSYIEALLTRVF